MPPRFLQPGEDAETTGAKFVLDCNGMVVVKIAPEDLQKEWDMYNLLKSLDIPDLTTYFCYFRCADSITRLVQPFCEGMGDTMQVLVMEHVAAKSFKSFDWSKVHIGVMRSCIKHAIMFALVAYRRCGFVHGDFHLDNILVQPTHATAITYDSVDLPLLGYQIRVLDFEFSKTDQPVRRFFEEVRVFVRKLLQLDDFLLPDDVNRMSMMIRSWIDGGEQDPDVVLRLLPMCDTLRSNGPVSCGGSLPHRRPYVYFGRKKGHRI